MFTNVWVGAGLILLAVAVLVGISIVLRRNSPRGGFFRDTERAGSIFSIIGTMFSVLLALVILLSVETYSATESHANAEADSVLEQFQLAEFFPSLDQYRVQSELICYSRGVIDEEWPLMREDRQSEVVDQWSHAIDEALDSVTVRGSKAEVGFDLFLNQTLKRQAERRGRLEGATGTLPAIVWPILILGALSVILYVVYYADRAERVISQIIQVGLVTVLLGSSLLLIRALDRPFSANPGAIEPEKMELSLAQMEARLGDEIDAASLTAVLPCDEAGIPLPTDPPEREFPAGTTMARIASEGKIVIGVSQTIALFGELDPVSGEASGFDVDLGREIARELGLREDQIEFVDTLIDDRIPSVAEGRVDIVVQAATITPERLDLVDFSRPYYLAGQSILVDTNRRVISSIRDLDDKLVCVLPSSTNAATLDEHAPGAELVFLPNLTDCVAALKRGEVHAVSTDDIILAGFAARDPELVLVGDQITEELYGVMIPKGQDDMVEFVNGVIDAMIEDGRWGKLYYRYLGDIPGLPSVEAAKERLPQVYVPSP